MMPSPRTAAAVREMVRSICGSLFHLGFLILKSLRQLFHLSELHDNNIQSSMPQCLLQRNNARTSKEELPQTPFSTISHILWHTQWDLTISCSQCGFIIGLFIMSTTYQYKVPLSPRTLWVLNCGTKHADFMTHPQPFPRWILPLHCLASTSWIISLISPRLVFHPWDCLSTHIKLTVGTPPIVCQVHLPGDMLPTCHNTIPEPNTLDLRKRFLLQTRLNYRILLLQSPLRNSALAGHTYCKNICIVTCPFKLLSPSGNP